MRTALAVLLVCAALDMLACLVLFAFVWAEHRRVRREAAAAGQPVPPAGRQLGCLAAAAVAGLVVLYGLAGLLLWD